jgi:hypothetical protein
MNKTEYKITYKMYYNKRLKKSLFHTKLMYPLYVQVIFGRVPITFKSYYFDLFSKAKYAIRIAGEVYPPDIKEIIQKEKILIEFIIDKNKDNFSLELFKKQYAFYSRDLLEIMEDDFLDYLFTFLHDEGLPYLADAIKKGSKGCQSYDLVRDIKIAFNSTIYKRLIENSFYYAPPYLPLYGFTEELKRTPLTSLTVMEWEQPETKGKFISFYKERHPGHRVEDAIKKNSEAGV